MRPWPCMRNCIEKIQQKVHRAVNGRKDYYAFPNSLTPTLVFSRYFVVVLNVANNQSLVI